MKSCLIVVLMSACLTTFGQGLVKFVNGSLTLISVLDGATSTVLPSNDGTPGNTFYFALLTAPLGATDPSAFTFSGLYATNTSVAGRVQGGSLLGIVVQGWATDETKAYELAGWSANAGLAWDPAWLVSRPGGPGQYFGLSMIGTGAAGPLPGSDPGPVPFSLFGAAPALSSGFVLTTVPEPSAVWLGAVAVTALVVSCRRGRNGKT